MNRKRSQLQAYFAGLFDGEGCIGMNGANKSGIAVIVGMTDPQAVGLIAKEYPEACVYLRPYVGTTNAPCYLVRINYHKAYNFLRDIEPFVIVKRDQVKVALAYLAHRRRDHFAGRTFGADGKPGCSGFDCAGRCERLIQRLTELKRVDYKGVNSVNLGELREYRAKPEDVEADQKFIVDMISSLWEGVETRDRLLQAVEPISAPEKDIVQAELQIEQL
jgi:hypothetical protein